MQKVSEELFWQSLCTFPLCLLLMEEWKSDLCPSLKPPRDLDPSAIGLIQALQLYNELSWDKDEMSC